MMRTLRKKMRLFLWVMVIAFAGAMAVRQTTTRRSPRSGKSTVAEVNGQSVSYDSYRAFLNQFRREELERLGLERLDEAAEAQLEEIGFEQLITEILWWQEIGRRGIRVTDEEVLAFIRSSPPQQLLEDTTLFTDGQFDSSKYLAAISDPRNLPWLRAYEREIRANLPKQKLQMDLLSSVRLTHEELRRVYEARNQRLRVRYLLFDPADHLKDISPDEGDLLNYFQTNRADFSQPEKVKLSWSILRKTPSLEDELAVKEEIQELRRRIEEGESFSQLAQEFSEDPATRRNGGELGFIGKGDLVEPLEEVCFSLKVGEVSPPVRTAYGWHLVKIGKKKGKTVKTSHLLLRVLPSYETLQRTREIAENLLNDAKKVSLEETADVYRAELGETPLFSRQGELVPGVGESKEAVKFAFTAQVGALSDLVETPEGYWVFRLIERVDAGIPRFEDIRRVVEQAFLKEKARELAFSEAKAVAEEISKGSKLKKVARRRSLKVRETPLFTMAEENPRVPSDKEFRGVCSALKQGEVSGIVETEGGFYLVELLNRTPLEEEESRKELPEFAQTLLMEKQSKLLENWFQNLRAEAKVKDYRTQFR